MSVQPYEANDEPADKVKPQKDISMTPLTPPIISPSGGRSRKKKTKNKKRADLIKKRRRGNKPGGKGGNNKASSFMPTLNSVFSTRRESSVLPAVAVDMGLTDDDLENMDEKEFKEAFVKANRAQANKGVDITMQDYEEIQKWKEVKKREKMQEKKKKKRQEWMNKWFPCFSSPTVKDASVEETNI